MGASGAIIVDIPVNVFADNILPLCEVKDAISFCCIHRSFALIANDETFWKRKLAIDYNFTGSETGRTNGWKSLYRRFRNPRIFVWGYVTPSSRYCAGTFIFSLMHSCVLAGAIQVGLRQIQTCDTAVSTRNPWERPFSGRTSPSRRSPGQPGDNP